MLKKLHWKFVLINMTIVSLAICFAFALLYFSTSRSLERESIQMMNSIALNPLHLAPPTTQDSNVHLPYFSVLVNHVGEIIETGGGFFDLSDQELQQQLLEKTFETHQDIGVLKEYNLRFLKTDTPEGLCVVFVDMSSEQSMLHGLWKSFLVIGFLMLLAFGGISHLLAKWAMKPVEKAWRQQKQFVADSSHELKTPITVIMTDAELIHEPECSEEERFQLSAGIISMAEQMRGLVESLLELAKIDSGSTGEEKKTVSFSDVTREEAMLLEPVFFERQMDFSYEVEEDIYLMGNEKHLQQLIRILLDNALKYSVSDGKVVLSLKSSGAKKCLLKVSNEGNPIPEEELSNLFRRFYRADKSRTGGHSYGLGLSIGLGIVKEHNGRIWAESEKGYNSFFAELPKQMKKRETGI